MSSYKELQKQIAELQMKAHEAKSHEMQGAISQIKELMHQFGITSTDILGPGKKKTTKGKPTAVVFRDGENTWSGRGRMPGWLAGKDKEQYRVE